MVGQTGGGAVELTLPAEVVRDVLEHARAGAPFEVCGLLAGRGRAVVAAYRIRNIADAPERAYMMDPVAQVRALYEIEAAGLELAAIYHSHPPGSRALPSPTDLAQATWPGTPYVIVVPPAGEQPPEIRAFLLHAEGWEEIPVRQG